MADRRQAGIEFWYDFDNQTLWRRTQEITDAFVLAYGPLGGSLDAPASLFALSFQQPNHPTPFINALQAGRQGFLDLAEAQRRIITAHFGNDADALRFAFEDFGQGVLFDNRLPRRVTHFIHMMDGTPADWVGYHRWHAAIRAAMVFGADAAWYGQLCRNIALAWGVQTEANPPIDRNDNPGLPAARRQVLSDFWMGVDFAELDRAFVKFKKAAPRPEDLQKPELMSFEAARVANSTTRYQRVQDILNRAAGDGTPFHEDRARFWNLPLVEFVALTVYDVPIIAPEGADRGARSGLIKALKGEAPFGTGGDFPQMPLNRPPVAPGDIAYIQNWINDNCPDEPDPPPPPT